MNGRCATNSYICLKSVRNRAIVHCVSIQHCTEGNLKKNLLISICTALLPQYKMNNIITVVALMKNCNHQK